MSLIPFYNYIIKDDIEMPLEKTENTYDFTISLNSDRIKKM